MERLEDKVNIIGKLAIADDEGSVLVHDWSGWRLVRVCLCASVISIDAPNDNQINVSMWGFYLPIDQTRLALNRIIKPNVNGGVVWMISSLQSFQMLQNKSADFFRFSCFVASKHLNFN